MNELCTRHLHYDNSLSSIISSKIASCITLTYFSWIFLISFPKTYNFPSKILRLFSHFVIPSRVPASVFFIQYSPLSEWLHRVLKSIPVLTMKKFACHKILLFLYRTNAYKYPAYQEVFIISAYICILRAVKAFLNAEFNEVSFSLSILPHIFYVVVLSLSKTSILPTIFPVASFHHS